MAAVAAVALVGAGAVGWAVTRPGAEAHADQAGATSPSTGAGHSGGNPQAPSVGGDTAGPATNGRAHVATAAPSQVVAERPRTLTLPSGVTMPVDAAATAADGELAIPTDINRAGWWDGSSRLGDPYGSIVIAAHVDSFTQGLGRFVELLGMHPGDVVTLSGAEGTQRFRVVVAHLVPKSMVSRGSNIFSATGDPRLVLLTCGGDYIPAQGGYQDNMVVEAVPIGRLAAR